MELNQANQIKEFEKLVFNVDFQNETASISELNQACDLLRLSETLRKNASAKFYQFIYFKLIDFVKRKKTFTDSTLVLLLKLIRNASGTNKDELFSEESYICDFLIESLNPELNSNACRQSKDDEENYRNSVIYILQYFSNLIQGKRLISNFLLINNFDFARKS